MISNRQKQMRTASIISLFGNLFLAILKIVYGISSKSSGILADGIDSSSDVLISIASLLVVKIISKPADAGHPWGHRREETVVTAFLSFVLFFSGAQLVITNISELIGGSVDIMASPMSYIVTGISILGKSALAFSQYILGRRAESEMLKANTKNMISDILVSASVIVGLLIYTITGSAIADSVIAALIGLWVIRTAIDIFVEVNDELMDGSTELEPYKIIFEAVNSVKGAFSPHRARMRNVAGFWDIDFDILVDPKCSIAEAHGIAVEVENAIKQKMDNVLDIVIHVEPLGDDGDGESFGLSEKSIDRYEADGELR